MNKRAAAIIIDGNKLLLLEHTKKDESYYVLPGGHVEEDESEEDACIREIKEECNLDIKIIKKIAIGYFKKYQQEEIFFLCEIIGGELTNEFDPDRKYGQLITDMIFSDFDDIEGKDVRPKDFFEWFDKNKNKLNDITIPENIGKY